MKNKISLAGRARIIKRNVVTGEIIENKINNKVVDSGLGWIAERLLAGGGSGATAADMDWIEVGSNSGTPSAGDTGLGATFDSGETPRKASTSVTRSGAEWEIVVDWGTSDINVTGIKEAGIFNSSVQDEGILLARITFPTINKTSVETFQIIWNIEFEDDGV